ncbi:MAG: hypothetical protein QXQ81_01545 [Candidatus Thorarchaeota archaeon]
MVDFANLIATHFAEIWAFLIFVGRLSGIVVILVGAILWLTEINPSKGKGLVLSGLLLSVVVQYFVTFPPSFSMG